MTPPAIGPLVQHVHSNPCTIDNPWGVTQIVCHCATSIPNCFEAAPSNQANAIDILFVMSLLACPSFSCHVHPPPPAPRGSCPWCCGCCCCWCCGGCTKRHWSFFLFKLYHSTYQTLANAMPWHVPNVAYPIYVFLQLVVACDVQVTCLGSAGQSCTPMSIRYSSIATSSLQLFKGSQVESPWFHFTRNSMFLPFHLCSFLSIYGRRFHRCTIQRPLEHQNRMDLAIVSSEIAHHH